MQVRVARHAGVCYGVERAFELATDVATGATPVHTLGPLIHNPQAVEALRKRGVEVADTLDDVHEGTLVIRTHGVDPAIIEAARAKGLDVVDATCPFVSKVHDAAHALIEEGYSVIVVGEADHPEVEGIRAHAGGDALIVQSAAELPEQLPGRRLGIVVQTTQSAERLEEVVAAVLPSAAEVRVFNTICSATAQRQHSAEELAGEVDVMVVVGGRNSGNTTRLTEISSAVNPRTHHVETAEELDQAWFAGASLVGVTAGASTPDVQMADVIEAIESIR